MPYKSEIERRNQFLWTQLLFLLTATLSLQTFVRNLNVLLLDILLLGHSTFDRFLLLDILLLTILFLIVACWIGGPSRGDMVGRRQELLHRPEQNRAQRTCPAIYSARRDRTRFLHPDRRGGVHVHRQFSGLLRGLTGISVPFNHGESRFERFIPSSFPFELYS
jgi:hypothetical protein